LTVPISSYLQDLRAVVGPRLLLLPGVAAIVRDASGRVLFIRRADDGRWGLPAGAVDPGESPVDAIVREVREETGLVVRPTRVAGVFGGAGYRHRYPNGDEVEWVVAVFDCDVLGGVLAPQDGEALGFRYFDPEDAPALQLPYPRALFDRPSSQNAAREALFG
jgi:8-oxo-dGTP pyrophosphatase MutT (NUDIX family)